MTDPLRQFQPGERFVPRANTLNAFVDAARAHRDGPADERPGDLAVHARTILVKNQSGWNLPRHACVALDEPIVLPADNPAEFAKRVAFRGVAPLEGVHEGKWAVLAEPLGDGKIGRAWAHGVFPALVGVTDSTLGGKRCEIQQEPPGGPEPGQEGYVLKLDPRGTGEVLWIEAGTGIKRAVVRLDGGVPLKLGCGLKRDGNSGEVAIDPGFFGHGLFYTSADPEADPPTPCRLDGNVRSFSLNEDLGGAHGTAETSEGEVLSAPTSFGYAFGEGTNGWDDPTLVPAINIGQGTWIAIGSGHHAVLGCAGEAHDGFEWEGECLASAVDAIPLHGLPSDAVGTVVLPASTGTTFTEPHTIAGCLFPHAVAADETVVAHKIKPLFVPVLSSPLLPPVVEEIHWVALPIRPPGGDPDLGCGLTRDEETGEIGIDPAMFGDGLEFLDCVLSVKTGCGLAIDGAGNVTVASDDLAGAGLVPGAGCALDVNPGEGITVAGDEVAIDIPSLPADSTPEETDVVATHDGSDHRRVTVEDVRGFLGDHKDTVVAGPEFAQVLKFVDPFWSNAFLHLYELADTLIQNPVAGHHLKHDGTRWINYLPDKDGNFHGCCGWVWNANTADWCWKFGNCDPEEDKPATPPPFTPYHGQLVIICAACGKPSICVEAIGDPIAEDGEAGAFHICRTGSTEEPLVVHFTLSGTAVEGTDYETLDSNTEATIPIGEACVFVQIIPIDNAEDDGDRTVILTLEPDAAYSINEECDDATLTIEDDEGPTELELAVVHNERLQLVRWHLHFQVAEEADATFSSPVIDEQTDASVTDWSYRLAGESSEARSAYPSNGVLTTWDAVAHGQNPTLAYGYFAIPFGTLDPGTYRVRYRQRAADWQDWQALDDLIIS